ncbi:hypothetical protein P7C70_g8909, partial [Phenoliferia sp. Uapishka_3]
MDSDRLLLRSNLSSRRSTTRHSFCGLDLSGSRRNVSLVLLFGTILSVVLLTARYHLAHPDDHPYGKAGSSIGSQAYSPSFHIATSTGEISESNKETTGMSSGKGNYDMLEDDWMEEEESWATLLGEGMDKWDPLKNNSRPLTEITLKSCVLPPGLYDLCAPLSSKKVSPTAALLEL